MLFKSVQNFFLVLQIDANQMLHFLLISISYYFQLLYVLTIYLLHSFWCPFLQCRSTHWLWHYSILLCLDTGGSRHHSLRQHRANLKREHRESYSQEAVCPFQSEQNICSSVGAKLPLKVWLTLGQGMWFSGRLLAQHAVALCSTLSTTRYT